MEDGKPDDYPVFEAPTTAEVHNMLADPDNVIIYPADDIFRETPETALITLKQQNEILLKHLANIIITNKDERINVGDMLITGRKAIKEVKAKLAELIQPAKDEQSRIKSIFDPFITQLETGLLSINRAMSNYDLEQDQIARQALIESIKDTVDTTTGEITETVGALEIQSKTTQANAGTFSKQDSFDVIIISPDLIPRQYCDPSLVKLRAAFKSGITEIPGALKQPKKVYQTRTMK